MLIFLFIDTTQHIYRLPLDYLQFSLLLMLYLTAIFSHYNCYKTKTNPAWSNYMKNKPLVSIFPCFLLNFGHKLANLYDNLLLHSWNALIMLTIYYLSLSLSRRTYIHLRILSCLLLHSYLTLGCHLIGLSWFYWV